MTKDEYDNLKEGDYIWCYLGQPHTDIDEIVMAKVIKKNDIFHLIYISHPSENFELHYDYSEIFRSEEEMLEYMIKKYVDEAKKLMEESNEKIRDSKKYFKRLKEKSR